MLHRLNCDCSHFLGLEKVSKERIVNIFVFTARNEVGAR